MDGTILPSPVLAELVAPTEELVTSPFPPPPHGPRAQLCAVNNLK